MSYLIAMVAGYTRALTEIAKQDGGIARYLQYLKSSLASETVAAFLASQVMEELTNKLATVIRRRLAHPAYIDHLENVKFNDLEKRVNRQGVSDIRDFVHEGGAIPILLATAIFDRNGLAELSTSTGGEWGKTEEKTERTQNMKLKEGRDNSYNDKMLKRYRAALKKAVEAVSGGSGEEGGEVSQGCFAAGICRNQTC